MSPGSGTSPRVENKLLPQLYAGSQNNDILTANAREEITTVWVRAQLQALDNKHRDAPKRVGSWTGGLAARRKHKQDRRNSDSGFEGLCSIVSSRYEDFTNSLA